MSYRLPPLNALRAFEVAARHLSFKHAAEELCVTPTAISHQIKQLEEFMGAELFRRLTRSLELTTAGKAMLPKVREGIECFAAALEQTRQPRAQERLVVVAPPSFATRWLVPRLRHFAELEPGIELHLVSSLHAIDTDQGGVAGVFDDIDLRDGDSHAAICFGTGSYPGFRVDRILSSGYVPVCSPALVNGAHPLHVPDDVRFQTLIHDETIADEKARPTWDEWLRLAGVRNVDAAAGPHFRDSGLALAAAIDGLGIALASKPLAATEVAAGRLVVPFRISFRERFAYYLVTPEATAQRTPAVALRQWLFTEAAETEAFCREHC
jgi:LysR family transcriptional regulator, glycine cleavage system transcriptional activator